MKLIVKNNVLILVLLIISSFFLGSCVKTDEYIDWKVMNDEWYDAHKTDAGYKMTPSGLCYKVIRLGNPSDRIPNPTSYIKATYKKKLIDGTVFSEGVDKYLPYTLNYLESGLSEGLSMMHTGDIYEFYIPYELTLTSSGGTVNSTIPKYSTIIYNIELIDSEY